MCVCYAFSHWCRVGEGSESILFREKFADWPEPGRIIKMKGHTSSGEFVVSHNRLLSYTIVYRCALFWAGVLQ